MNRPSVKPSLFCKAPLVVISMVLLIGCAKGFDASSLELENRPPSTSDPLTAEDQRRWDAAERLENQVAPVLESDFERESFFDDVTEQKPKYSQDQLAEQAEKVFLDRAHQIESKKTSSPTGSAKLPARPNPSLQSSFCQSLNVTSPSSTPDTTHLYNKTSVSPVVMNQSDLTAGTSQDKKNRFVCLLLPMAIRLNEEVFRMRIEVLRLQSKAKKGLMLTDREQAWITDMKKSYDVAANDTYEILLKRVDIIPIPLLLAQAALESGWGTSRATVDLKNLFGIHAVRDQKCKTGYDTHNACVRQFDTLEASVSAYIQLLNAGTHYPQFREARAQMRKAGESLDSVKLLSALGKYNETPLQYIKNVRELMTRSNKLTQFAFQEDAVQINTL